MACKYCVWCYKIRDTIVQTIKQISTVFQRLLWGICVGVVAGFLMLFGGLKALRIMTIVALPFSIVFLFSCFALEKALQIEGEWPLHSFSVKGTDANQKAIAAADFSNDFSENVAGVWSLCAFQVADAVDLVMPHQDFNTNQLIKDIKHFPIAVTEDDDSVLVFSTHDYISEAFYQSQASVTFDESSSIFGSSVIKTHQQVISTKATDSFLVKANEQKPPIDDRNFSEIKEDGNYDYSAVSGYPLAVISFTFTAYDADTSLLMPAKWTFYGPEQGMLAISADLTGYEDIINIDTDKKSTDIHLIKSMMTNNYRDYIKYYQAGNTVESALDVSSDFVKKLDEVEISIKLK